MKLPAVTTCFGLVVACMGATSAVAASGCSTAPAAQWQPKSKLEQKLSAEGMKVSRIKVENGCYEVYAKDKDGHRKNMAFNAETFKQLENAEAGEK
jgi:hypothetical protein